MVDDQTGRGVPLVELQTTSAVSYYTDSNGLIAFDEPGLMNRKVWFIVDSPGYEYPADFIGSRGIALETKPGGSATIKIKRNNIAERMHRAANVDRNVGGPRAFGNRHYFWSRVGGFPQRHHILYQLPRDHWRT